MAQLLPAKLNAAFTCSTTQVGLPIQHDGAFDHNQLSTLAVVIFRGQVMVGATIGRQQLLT
jgi:hypothetical protein